MTRTLPTFISPTTDRWKEKNNPYYIIHSLLWSGKCKTLVTDHLSLPQLRLCAINSSQLRSTPISWSPASHTRFTPTSIAIWHKAACNISARVATGSVLGVLEYIQQGHDTRKTISACERDNFVYKYRLTEPIAPQHDSVLGKSVAYISGGWDAVWTGRYLPTSAGQPLAPVRLVFLVFSGIPVRPQSHGKRWPLRTVKCFVIYIVCVRGRDKRAPKVRI